MARTTGTLLLTAYYLLFTYYAYDGLLAIYGLLLTFSAIKLRTSFVQDPLRIPGGSSTRGGNLQLATGNWQLATGMQKLAASN
jgi:hypothetical protein